MSDTIGKHSYAYDNKIHYHSDDYYNRLKAKPGADASKVDAQATQERAAAQAYQKSTNYTQDRAAGFKPKTGLTSEHPDLTPSGKLQVSAVPKVGGANATRDGYTVDNAVADMTKLAHANGTQLPPADKLQDLAHGIIDGVNANFSGVNGIGDYAKVPGAQMAKTLIGCAYQESKFNTNGQDGGGVFQAAANRVDDYNQKFGTSYSQADLKDNVTLASKVSTWAIANPTVKPGYQMVGTQAGSVPIPKDLPQQALYYWNYNPTGGHGHANELEDYMQENKKWDAQLG